MERARQHNDVGNLMEAIRDYVAAAKSVHETQEREKLLQAPFMGIAEVYVKQTTDICDMNKDMSEQELTEALDNITLEGRLYLEDNKFEMRMYGNFSVQPQ